MKNSLARSLLFGCASLCLALILTLTGYAAGRHQTASSPMNLAYTVNPPKNAAGKAAKTKRHGQLLQYKIYIWNPPYVAPTAPPNSTLVRSFSGDSVDVDGKDEIKANHPRNHVQYKTYVAIYSI